MLTLTEAWKKSYEEYLEETENSIDDTLIDLVEATQEINKGFEYIKEYFELVPLDEKFTADSVPPDNRPNALDAAPELEEKDRKSDSKKVDYNPEEITSFLMKQLGEKIINSDSKSDEKAPDYEVKGISTVEDISDMKFPKNVIFFLQQLIAWIKRVVVFFIEKIKNIFRAIVGQKTKELNTDALKLQLSKVRELETIYTPSIEGKKDAPVKLMAVKADDVNRYYALKESFNAIDEGLAADLGIIKQSKSDDIKPLKQPVIIQIDISKDLIHLKELVQHFYDLYDNAFGSNNEELFSTEDLELVLGLFRKTVDGLKNGDTPVYEIGSTAVEVSAIDSSRVRDNLIRTNDNIKRLKQAYTETAEMIKNTARVITHKEMLMLSGYGIDNKWLSSATYQTIIDILDTLKPRLKDAARNEKALTKMQKKYEAVSNELVKLQRAFNAYSNLSYTSVYQKRIIDLCHAAKYMTQVVTLRLTAIGMYIKEMKDIKDLMKALVNINNTRG